MRIAFLSGVKSFGIQDTALKEGNSINVWFSSNYFIKDPYLEDIENADVRNGNPNDILVDADFVIVDNNDFQFVYPNYNWRRYFTELAKNKPVVGASIDDMIKIEYDRKFAKKVAEKMGLKIPKTIKVSKSGLKNLVNTKKNFPFRKFMVKLDGGNQSEFEIRTYQFNSYEELKFVVENDIYGWLSFKGKLSFILEEFIEGENVNFSYYWDGNKIIPLLFLSREYKGAFTSDLGMVQTGEIGTVSIPVSREDLKPKFKKLTNKVEKELRKLKGSKIYKGLFDINTIINDKGIYFLEFTPRIGVPSQDYELVFMLKNVSNFYGALAGYIKDFDYLGNVKSLNTPYLSVCIYPYGIPLDVASYEGKETYVKLDKKVVKEDDLTSMAGRIYYDEGYIKSDLSERIAIFCSEMNIEDTRKSEVYTKLKGISGPYVVYREDVGADFDYKKIMRMITNVKV